MVQFNFSERTIKAKVVYYGPAQSGKTTNLEQIHRLTDPSGQQPADLAQHRPGPHALLRPAALQPGRGRRATTSRSSSTPSRARCSTTPRAAWCWPARTPWCSWPTRAARMAKENLAAFENMKVNLLANRLVPGEGPARPPVQQAGPARPACPTAELEQAPQPLGPSRLRRRGRAGRGRDRDVRGGRAGDAARHRGQVQPQGEGPRPRARSRAGGPGGLRAR